MKRDVATRCGDGFLDEPLGPLIRLAAFPREDVELLHAVERCLHEDCAARAAGAEQGHRRALHLDAVVAQVVHEARTIGVMPDELAVLVLHDDADGTHDAGCFGQAVEVLDHGLLVRHRGIRAVPAVALPHGVQDVGYGLEFVVKREVDRIHAASCERVRVDCRRHRVVCRLPDERDEVGVSADDRFGSHKGSFLVFRSRFAIPCECVVFPFIPDERYKTNVTYTVAAQSSSVVPGSVDYFNGFLFRLNSLNRG